MRYTAIYVRIGHAATCKEIEAATVFDALRKARQACPIDRKLGHITGNHTGHVVWDSEQRKKKGVRKK